ncbi:hypothetical protein, partial [Marinobacter alexandrii]|uniref:hypothetical protein n=1 Tax=Marinobacter alexandrii TaxID=2570351 RepID=UPI0032983F79
LLLLLLLLFCPRPLPAASFLSEIDTGNSCKHIGYDEFEPKSWPGKCSGSKDKWIELNRSICGENGAYPEEFWACSDISISSGEPT